MRYGTVTALVALTIGFWGFVIWVADAFDPLELAAIVVGLVVFFGVWLWWEVRHAIADPEEDTETFVPEGWADGLEDVDWSSVRHGGLGR